MAGLDSAIHDFPAPKDVDARVKPAHDGIEDALRCGLNRLDRQ
jgi:hypothetical protein